VNEKWDCRFLGLAKFVAQWSYDPSTKTGAVIVDPDKRVVSVGYNGFPKGVSDDQERYANRDMKYKLIVHCERNAMLFAGRSMKGCTLYTYPFMSCSPCAAMVIQAGIVRCVAPEAEPEQQERWREDFDLAKLMFNEADVRLDLLFGRTF
jgi:dCMP deaminase